MTDWHKLTIYLPNGKNLIVGPVENDANSEVSIIAKKIRVSFATKKTHGENSVLVIEKANESYHIPYAMFNSGLACWVIERVNDTEVLRSELGLEQKIPYGGKAPGRE